MNKLVKKLAVLNLVATLLTSQAAYGMTGSGNSNLAANEPIEVGQEVADVKAAEVLPNETNAAEQSGEEGSVLEEYPTPSEEVIDQEAEPVEETESTEETEPVEEMGPIEETEPVEGTEPIEETKPVEGTEPIEETEPVEGMEPIEEAKPIEQGELEGEGGLEQELVTRDLLVQLTSESQGAEYADGTYIGEGTGYNTQKKIQLQVTIKDGKISDIGVLEQNETESFWEKCQSLIEWIKNMGNPSRDDIEEIEIDTVTGASVDSKTSAGIKEAMIDALSQAVIDESTFSSGEGTAESPYLISNRYQLSNFSQSVADGKSYEGQYIQLSHDMDLSGQDWQPIGSENTPFEGHFSGDGYEISGMQIGNEDSPVNLSQAGFFGNIGEGASVSELTLSDARIYITDDSGNKIYAGGLAGYVNEDSIIDQCEITNSIIFAQANSEQMVYVGGMVGNLNKSSILTNSTVEANVRAISGNTCYVGGLVGFSGNQTLLMNSKVSGQSEAHILSSGKEAAKAVAGGVVGMAAGVVYNCYTTSQIEAINEKNGENVQEAGIVAWCTSNGCIINNLYDGSTVEEAVIIYPAGQTIELNNQNVQKMTAEQVKSLLNKNLSPGVITAAQQELETNTLTVAKDFGFRENATKCTFYSWQASSDEVHLTQDVWRPEFNASEIFESGTGTKEDPYLLKTEEQLRKFATSLSDSQDYTGTYIELMNDIDVSSEIWIPIGEGEYPFKGHFNGESYKIDGIRIKGDNDEAYTLKSGEMYFGLFGVVGSGAVVENLGVVNVEIDVQGKASTVVGGIAGLNDGGLIDSCYVTGNLKGETTTKGNNYAGGIVGWSFKGYIVNSYSDAYVHSSVIPTALAMAGGIVGMANRTVVANCYSLGENRGYTERKLEEVESMAAVGGIAGVAGAPIVNSYVLGDTISEDYSYYVGATVGWATGIAQLYNLYYNQEAVQMIKGENISPISHIGWLVGPGTNDEGEVYGGTLNYDITGKKLAEMETLVEQLNSNFKAFPLDEETLPSDILLKKWVVKEGRVTFSEEYAPRTYVAPPVDKPALTGNYYNGTFYGRALIDSGDNYLQVTLKVENKQIVSITSQPSVIGADEIIKQVLSSQEASNIEEADSKDMIAFKTALRVATVRALKGDHTDYNPVDPKIFAGGEGTQKNPFKISTAEQLVKFAASINEVEDFKGKYVVLTKDIDLKGIQWVPAGGSGLYPFAGSFDGKHFTIKNMTIGTEEEGTHYSSVGLFAHLNEATVKNLRITNAFIHNTQVTIPTLGSQKVYVGLIAGYAGKVSTKGSRGVVIDQCYVEGRIISESVESNYVGGLIGSLLHSSITNSAADCQIEAITPGNWVYAGGLVGLPAFSVVANNYAYGKIQTDTAVNKSQVGGIAGMHSSYSFNNYAEVELSTKNQTINIGALAGTNSGIAYLQGSYSNTQVNVQTGDKNITGQQLVGNIVNGETYGKGQVVDSILQSQVNSSLTALLNTQKDSIKSQEWYKTLVEAWAVYLPEDLTFSTWRLSSGKLTFTKKSSGNNSDSGSGSGGQTNDNSGGSSNNSGSSSNSGGKPGTDKNQQTTPENVPPQEGQKPQKQEKVFSDVKLEAWYYDAIQFVNDRKLMSGVSENEFAPQLSMTRAMLITVLYQNESSPELEGVSTFNDVRPEAWFAKAVAWGKMNEIVKGASEKEFKPNDKVTREQVAIMLYEYAKWKGYDVSSATSLTQFKDQPSSWAKEAVQWAISQEIIQGKGQSVLDPKGNCTRAEAAQILMRFIEKYDNK